MVSSRLSYHDYTIAWICALSVELTAAKAMLDVTHSSLPQSPTDHNTYTLGRLGVHNVVIVCLPSGIYGTVSAATVLAETRSTFQSLQFGLMVGIGGGVPGKVDIRLGDVVVSQPTPTTGGVIQYDLGKTISNGRLHRTGSLNNPPQVLLTAINHIQNDDFVVGQQQIRQIIDNTLTKSDTIGNQFSQPHNRNDWLFCATYNHQENASDCSRCDQNQLIRRRLRATDEPCIHYGLIASGNQVMKDAQTRDRIGDELDILCFEMEAAGLMNQLPCLVIRGISDYCDSHKNEDWKGCAALNAAAYAKNLLSVVPIRRQNSSQIATPKYDSLSLSCLEALQCPDPFFVKTRLKETKDKLLFEATEWIFGDSQYLRWKNEDNVRLLWVRGGAGKGKTMLSIGLIERMSQDDSSIITYFFCRKANYKLNTIEAVIKGFIRQLVRQRPELIEVLKLHRNEVRSCSKGKMVWRGLWDIFWEMVSQCKRQRVYIVLDALDECWNQGLAGFLRMIVRTGLHEHNVKWFLASRPFDGADQALLTTADQVSINLELKASDLEAAVKIYISFKVGGLYSPRKYELDILQEIESELLKRAEGTFLWVSLLFQRLERKSHGDPVPPDEALLIIRDQPPIHALVKLYECFENLRGLIYEKDW